MTEESRSPSPPTIAYLRGMGVTGARAACLEPDCRRFGTVAWEAMDFPEGTLFTFIQASQRLRCSGCGSRWVSVMPDWSGYKAKGGGV